MDIGDVFELVLPVQTVLVLSALGPGSPGGPEELRLRRSGAVLGHRGSRGGRSALRKTSFLPTVCVSV